MTVIDTLVRIPTMSPPAVFAPFIDEYTELKDKEGKSWYLINKTNGEVILMGKEYIFQITDVQLSS